MISIVGDWQLDVSWQGDHQGPQREVRATLDVRPPQTTVVTREPYACLPVYNPAAAGWGRGERPLGLRAFECTTCHALDPASLRVTAAASPVVFERGRDYQQDDDWGTLGRLADGRIAENQPVLLSYNYVKLRIDAVVLTAAGELVLREGEPHIATPLPPALGPGERRIANLWLPGRPLQRLGPENLFPVLETAYPEAPSPSPSVAERLLPRALQKLRAGGHLKILAWGDSVTECGYLPAAEAWQAQFLRRLQARFPAAAIELITEGWGGRTTEAYLGVPPGQPHNYQETVLNVRPDLIISEFVNDAGLNPAQVETRYARLLADFRDIGAEWVILTPHYVWCEWMGLNREREIDDDPRPYVHGLREFAARHHVALADAARRYGRLWRQGLPYSSLMTNTLNHPDARGMAIFADSLLALFPE